MRAKIILPNLLLVFVLGTASFFFLRRDLGGKAEESLRSRLDTVSALFARSESLRGYELLADLSRAAMAKDIVNAFEPFDLPAQEGRAQSEIDAEVRQTWFKKCSAAIRRYLNLAGDKKRPDLVVLTDRAGVAVARNITPNACPTGFKLGQGMSVVERALDGEAAFSVWSVEDSPFNSKKPDAKFCQLMNAGLLQLAAAPIWIGDDIVGTMVLGFELSNGTAKEHAEVMKVDVALVKGGHVYSSSFETDKARGNLEAQLKSPSVSKMVDEALKTGRRSDFFEITVEGEPYSAVAVPVANADVKDRVVTLLMGSKTKAKQGLRSLSAILYFMGFSLIAIFVAGMMLSAHFLKPVMEIEEGILKVINGDYNYRFDIKSSEVGGLSYRINQLIGVLTGEDEDSSDEE